MRLVLAAIAFAVGDACAGAGLAIGPARVVLLAGVALVAASATVLHVIPAAAGRAVRYGAGLAVVMIAGAALGTRAAHPSALDPALLAALDEDDPRALVATVERGPELTAGGARLVVELQRIDGSPATGTLSLGVASGWPDFGPGEVIAFPARLRTLRGTRNPGVADPALALRAIGIQALASVGAASAIARVAEPAWSSPRRLAFLVRRALRVAIEQVVSGQPAAFLRTAVLGDRRGVGADVEDGFRAAGATHVLSVSGLHLAAVAALLFVVIRGAAARIPALALSVDPRAVAAAVSLPAVWFFTLLTGEAVATERSALMLALGLGALLVGRRARPGPTIAGAALVLLVWQPLELFDVSFQLSVASVSGIAICARALGPRQRALPGAGRRLGDWLWRFGAATASATAATAPLVAHWFGEIAPLAPIGNLALVPLVELAVVPVGLGGAIAGALWPPLGHWPLRVAGWAASLALAIAAAFRAHAPIWVCRAPNPLETAATTAAGLMALRALGGGPWRRAWACGGALGAVLAGASLTARDLARRHSRLLVATFLDVGQGDAAVIEAPGGAVLVLDGGGTRDGAFDTGARIVEPFLRARGIGAIDLVALSHPHPDHLNGLFRVLQRFTVGAFWSSGDDGHNPEYGRLVALARARSVALPPVTTRPLGAARIEPLAPFVGDAIGAPPGLTVNDASLVLRVALGGHALLFPGDLEADGEGELAGRLGLGQDVTADVLKVPHHGSRTSSSEELLDAIHPGVAVISLGWHNQFHFPAPEVVDRYAARHIRLLRTDRDGAVTVTLAPSGALTVACERGCAQPAGAPAETSP